MLNNEQILEIAKAKTLIKKRDTDNQEATIEKFLSELTNLIDRGITIQGTDDLSELLEATNQYGQQIADHVRNITNIASKIPDLTQLNLPNKIKINHVTDDRLLDALEKVGDNGELLQKFASLDKALILLAQTISKTETVGSQKPKDYLPVRIVLGQSDNLRFLETWPMPIFGGGGGSVTDITPIKKFALGEFDSIVATYPTTSTEIYQYSLNGQNTYKITVTYTDSTKAVLTSAIRS